MITEMKAGHLKDIDKPSEPFEVIGKIIPRYENENWTFTELLYEAPYLKSYQDEEDEEDEEADCLEYIDNTDKIIYVLSMVTDQMSQVVNMDDETKDMFKDLFLRMNSQIIEEN
nr:sat4 [Campylobacter jejuni]